MADASDDFELLRRYVERHDEAAFARLVTRHTDMVYAAARRQVGAGHLAEEVTQATFVLLMRKADRLPEGTVVAGWLYKAARYAAANALCADLRRRKHERKAAEMAQQQPSPTSSAWANVAPHLDEAIARLRPAERSAVVLRFLERRSMAEVGAAMGVSEHAAQMRVSRALEKMRQFFARRGVAMSATALGVLVISHAAEAAPPGLAASLTVSSLKTANIAPGPTAALADGAACDMAVGQARGILAFAIAACFVIGLAAYTLHGLTHPATPENPPANDRPAVAAPVAVVR
ncbi:MAG: sigma-70 family RNA polymerase sigma factor [Tepidisphaeraceae bacterium]